MPSQLDSIIIAATSETDLAALGKLHEVIFGPGRFAKTAYRVREGQPPISAFCHTAKLDEQLIASVTFTRICIGAKPDAVMLGPLAVSPAYANLGIGRKLITTGLETVRTRGIRLVLLVGEPAYYVRFGFAQVAQGQIRLPGPADPARILACALDEAALSDYQGLVSTL